MAFSMPAGSLIHAVRWVASRGFCVVPLSTMRTASRFEKPSIRVYSSPNPYTSGQQHSGEPKSSPQKLNRAGPHGMGNRSHGGH